MRSSYILPILSFVSFCFASPVFTNAAVAKCRDLKHNYNGIDFTCWNTLKMNDWMINWNATAWACNTNEPWGTCFMRLTEQIDHVDCLVVSLITCSRSVVDAIVKGSAEIYYDAYSIWCKLFYRIRAETHRFYWFAGVALQTIITTLYSKNTKNSSILPVLDAVIPSLLITYSSVVNKYGPALTSILTNFQVGDQRPFLALAKNESLLLKS